MSTDAEIIEKTRQFLEEKFTGEGSGHDYAHMYRVWQVAQHIAADEKGVNMLVVELGALLHDIADWKFHGGDDTAGPRAAREWLEGLNVDEKIIEQIVHIVGNISFHSTLREDKPPLSHEAQIVHDADRLDAIGAIGIARVFTYGGVKGRPIHDPLVKPTKLTSPEQYRKSNETNTAINHFYEKLLLLSDMMYTKTGKQIAAHRHKFMLQFLDEFHAEWNGKK